MHEDEHIALTPAELRSLAVDGEAYLGTGWAFPVRWQQAEVEPARRIAEGPETPATQLQTATTAGLEDIFQAIRIILQTSRGERVMQPTFGCDLHQFVFMPTTEDVLSQIEEEVVRALTVWERRIRNVQAQAVMDGRINNRVDVDISFSIDTHRMRHSLVFPFYLLHPEVR